MSRRRTRRMFNAASAFDRRLVDQHHGNVVFDRVDPMTGPALQARPVADERDGGFAFRTDENFQQRRVDGHEGSIAAPCARIDATHMTPSACLLLIALAGQGTIPATAPDATAQAYLAYLQGLSADD